MKNISKMKLIPFLIYLILVGFSIWNNSFEFKVLGFILLFIFIFEYINLKISKIIRNYWKNQKLGYDMKTKEFSNDDLQVGAEFQAICISPRVMRENLLLEKNIK